ncbi:MAG: SulP family inorganic anion transporter [Polyangiaceae bacterium]|nr:SulP family inorganic anion transporter [Polyangiaceae bacterium]
MSDRPQSLAPPPPTFAGLVLRRIPAVGALRTYDWHAAKADLLAGLSVATVAVPQGMAYAIAAGVPVEYGLYTAIVKTAVASLFTSARQLINGPTNVVAIALLSALAPIPAEQKVASAIALGVLAGLIQLVITALRLGDLTRFISHSVVVGFTCGASLLLLLDQTRNLFGWERRGSPHDHFLVRTWTTWSDGGAPNQGTLLLGLGSIITLFALRWVKRRLRWNLFPDLLVTVVASAAVVALFRLDEAGVRVVGEIPPGLPGFAIPAVPMEHLRVLSEGAFAIATLGLLEALAMSKQLCNQSGQKLDLNQQCLSEGVANLAGSFFQCIPGSGSLTRSAINQQAGAVTQWSGVVSAAGVAMIMVLFAPYARYIPHAALAGILMVTAFGMIDWKALRFHVRATQFDAAIVAATAIAAVGISIEFCILIGVLASFVLAVPRAGRMTRTEFVVHEDGMVRERKEAEPPDERILVFGLEGELFFGSSLALDEHLDYMEARATEVGAKVIVLRAKRLRNPDAVGMHELARWIRDMGKLGIRVILSGVRADLDTGLRVGGAPALGPDQIFPERKTRGSSTIEALHTAYTFVDAHFPAPAAHKSSRPPAAEFQV